MRPPAQKQEQQLDQNFSTPQARRVEDGHTCAGGAMPRAASGTSARRGQSEGGAVISKDFQFFPISPI